MPDPLPPTMAVSEPGGRSAATECSSSLGRAVVSNREATSRPYVAGSSHDGAVSTETETPRVCTSTASTSPSERLPPPDSRSCPASRCLPWAEAV